MKWPELLAKVGNESLFHTGFLLVGEVDAADLRRQFCRWIKDGRLVQLRRGWYAVAEPYRKNPPHPFFTANRLKKGSYISLQSALAEHGLIPEHVPVVTSVTTGRPEELSTPLGAFVYQHVKPSWFLGYTLRELGGGQSAFVATPEKALLDLIYLTPQADDPDYLSELRLQHLDRLDAERLRELAARSGSAKVCRAAERLLRRREAERLEPL
jgi:predicted transcriptional regulator of viral defense system